MITELGDGIAKRQIQRFDAVPQNVLKPDEQRKFQSAALGLFNHVRKVHRRAGVLQRSRHNVPGLVDVVILRAPAMNVVKRARRFDVPRLRRIIWIAHLGKLKPSEL